MPSSDRADDEGSENVSEQSSTLAGNLGSRDQGRSGIFDNGFEAYRTVTEDDYWSLFTSGLIVLDANVLLDLYRYHPETRQELLDVLNRLRERLWVPNQAMAEFWARRESVLEDSSDITSTVKDLNKLGEQYMSRVRQWTNSAGLRQQTANNLVKITRSAFDVTIAKIRSLAGDKALKTAEDTAKDSVVTRLDSILQGRVGNPLTPERRRTAINQEAPQRFADKRPPGYMDANKKNDNPVGDYLIWIETLEEAARLKVDILFVTGDTKEDWWRQERGQAKGPHPQLVEEMWSVAEVRLFMLRPASFLKHAGDLLQLKVSPESVEDAQRVTAKVDSTWNEIGRSIEGEVAQKLETIFGNSSIRSPDFLRTPSGTRHEIDAMVRLPGKVPVFFEVKYATSLRADVNLIITAGLQQITHIASMTDALGVLILILPDEFTSADVEVLSGQAERRAAEYHSGLYTIYLARHSDFLAESAKDFVDRVIPPNLLDL